MCKLITIILSRFDVDKCTILASLDLSASFDTIIHKVLLNRLRCFGSPGLPLNGSSRTVKPEVKKVTVVDSLSRRRSVVLDGTQSSVLGARMFTMWMYPQALIFNNPKV